MYYLRICEHFLGYMWANPLALERFILYTCYDTWYDVL